MVFFTSIGLDEVFRQAEKGALEALIQFLHGQITNPLKSLDLVITNQWPHLFGQLLHIDVSQQIPAVVPSFFPVVYHQREYGVELFALSELVAVGRGIVVHHPRWHIFVRPGLVLNADQRDDDLLLADRQQLSYVPVLAVNLSVSFVVAKRVGICQHLWLDDLLAIEDEAVQYVRKDFVLV